MSCLEKVILLIFLFCISLSQSLYAQQDKWPIFINGSQFKSVGAPLMIQVHHPKSDRVYDYDLFPYVLMEKLLSTGCLIYHGCTYFIVRGTFDRDVLGDILEELSSPVVSLTPHLKKESVLDFYHTLNKDDRKRYSDLLINCSNFERTNYCQYHLKVGDEVRAEFVLGKAPCRLDETLVRAYQDYRIDFPPFEFTCSKTLDLIRWGAVHLFDRQSGAAKRLFESFAITNNEDGQWVLQSPYSLKKNPRTLLTTSQDSNS